MLGSDFIEDFIIVGGCLGVVSITTLGMTIKTIGISYLLITLLVLNSAVGISIGIFILFKMKDNIKRRRYIFVISIGYIGSSTFEIYVLTVVKSISLQMSPKTYYVCFTSILLGILSVLRLYYFCYHNPLGEDEGNTLPLAEISQQSINSIIVESPVPQQSTNSIIAEPAASQLSNDGWGDPPPYDNEIINCRS